MQARTLAVLATLAFFLTTETVRSEGVTEGQIPPDKLGKTTDGETLLVSEGIGRVQIITFWATWCPPCLKELPILNAIEEQAGSERIRVVAVNFKEPRDQFRRAMHAMRDYEIDFIHDRNGSLSDAYGVNALPHMVMIHPDGTVAFQHTGYNEEMLDTLIEQINSLLVQLPYDGGATSQAAGS